MSLIGKKLSFLFYIVIISFSAFSQINGSTTPSTGINMDYTFDNGSLYLVHNWAITNGTVISSTSNGTSYTATVQWAAGGAGTMSFRVKLQVIASLNVSVCGAAIPTGSFTYTPQCYSNGSMESTTISRLGSPPVGQTWYWQINDQNGTSTSSGSATYDASPGANLYLRGYENVSGCWSVGSLAAATIPNRSITTSGSSCGSGTVQLSALLGANGTEVRWYSACPGGSLVGTGTTFTTPLLSITTTYYASSYNYSTGAESPKTQVVAAIYPWPIAPGGSASPSVFCGPGTTTLAGTGAGANEVYRWYNVSTGGSTISTSQTVSSTTPFYVSRYNTVTGCEGSRTAVTVTVNPLPGLAGGIASPSVFCGSGTATLTGTGAGANEIYRWYNVSLGGSTISTSQTVSVTTPFYVSRFNTVTGCEGGRTAVTVTVNPIPGAAGGTVIPSSLCGPGTVTWNASGALTNEIYKWYNVSSGGTSITPATSISVTTILYVSRYNTLTTCEGSRTVVTVMVNPPVTTSPTITGNSRFGNGNLTIAGNGTPPGGNYKWYNASNAYQNMGPSYTTTSLSTSATNFMYVKSVSSAGCESASTAINIYIYSLPTISAPQNFVVKETSVTMDAGGGFDSYLWKNAANAVVATTPAFNTNVPNTYTVTVTKTGATGVSIPFVLSGSQFTGMNMNYIVTNVSQIGGITDAGAMQSLSSEKVAQSITYFDGLGRPMQSVATQTSPTKIDLVTPIVYDQYGREKRKYLPAVFENNGRFKSSLLDASGNYLINTYNSTADKIADDLSPFSETEFEASPLNRPSKDYGAGQAWAPVSAGGNDKFIQHDYLINSHSTASSATQEKIIAWAVNTGSMPVRLAASTGYVEIGGYYASGQISIKSTKDEAGNEVREYTDKLGRVILKKIQAVVGSTNLNSTTDWALTYYMYDNLGNLRFVLPPELSKLIHNNADTYVVTTSDLANWAFQYTYDSRKRMITKQVPGAGPVYMVYDNRDRLILTQDANQRVGATNAIKYWTFTKYDELNRPIMTGIKDTTTTVQLTQATMQAAVNGHFAKTSARWGETYIGSSAVNVHGYTNRSYPVRTGSTTTEINPDKYLTVTYYDNYSFRSLWNGTYTYFNENLTETANGIAYPQPAVENLRVVGQVTGSKTKVLDGGVTGGATWLKAVTYYDDKYRAIQNVADNYKGGIDRVTSVYDFVGKVLKTNSMHEESDVTWKDVVGAVQVGNRLIKTTTGNTWGNSGAASTQTLLAGQNGWLEFTVSETTSHRMVGLSDVNTDANYTSIDYALYQSLTSFQVYENGALKFTAAGALTPGEVLRVERNGTTVTYKRNSTLAYTSTIPSSTLLMADASLYSASATAVGVRTSFSRGSKTIARRFEYDHAGRLLKTWHKLDAQQEILLALNEYNELGQLVDKKLHSTVSNGSNAKQSVDYRYNIRGWLTSMNNAQLLMDNSNDDTNDLFGMNLAYNTTDLGLGNAALFNGNISGMAWSNNLGLGSVKQNGYAYTYDALNRIKTSAFKEKSATAWAAPTISKLAETGFNYDLNGNIINLKRNEKAINIWMDDLAYNYTGNQLQRVTDAGDDFEGFVDGQPNGATNDYTYDANGNMTRDLNKGIGTSLTDATNLITYNFLNLPETVTKGSNSIRYIYDATGRKLSQVTTFVGQQKQVDYAGEYQYENDVLQFISHEEGRIAIAGNKSMVQHTGDAVTNITAIVATLAPVIQNGTQTYIRATSVGTTAKQGMFPIGGTLAVQAGEQYRIRAKGYRTGANSVHLYIRTNSLDLNWPGAALASGLAAEAATEQIITIPAGHTTLQAGLVWNTVTAGQQFFLNDFEITKLTTNAIPEYQYNLKDHLGNVRLTFTSKDEIETGTATMETNNANTEQSQFLNYTEAIKVNNAIFDHTNAGGTYYSTRLTGGTTNAITGLAKSLSVMPGDKIDIEVFAKYLDPNSANWTAAMTSFMAAIAGGTAPAGTVIDGGMAGSLGSSTFPFPNVLVRNNDNSTGPKGYLNYLLFDRNYVYKTGGFKRLSTNARETGTDIPHERLAFDGPDQILIREPGYVYIWLSNENATTVEVYFDDFKVTHTKSPVIQTDDYYPFGLTFNSYSRGNSTAQDYKYNGKEEQNELGLGWLDFGFRMYDPAIAKFTGIDPLASKYHWLTPYNYAENSPVANIDLWGLQRYFAADGSLLGQVGDNTDVRVVNSTMTNQQATEHIQSGSAESTQALTGGSVAFADYFQTVADVTNDAALQTYSNNGNNCFDAATAQLTDAGVTQTGSADAIQTLVNTTADSGLTENAFGGAIRVQTELNAGNPVMVGVKETTTGGTAPDPGNTNSNTGHFVVIRSVTVAADGTVSFNYLDNAKASTGKSADNNNFSLNTSTGAMSDTTTPGGRTSYSKYEVSEVRKNN